MTRRITARSSVAVGDVELARLTTLDLSDRSAGPTADRPRSLRELAKTLVPASVVADVPEGVALGGWLRGLARRS